MDQDAFDDILDIEKGFYNDGYTAGLADGKQAGLIEGKLFGMEKGYEKALEMGRLQGRAVVWNERMVREELQKSDSQNGQPGEKDLSLTSEVHATVSLTDAFTYLEPIATNSRLQKHIESLLRSFDGKTLSCINSDEAVAGFEEQLARASAKAKVIANILGEPINPTQDDTIGIEDAKGLSARH